MKYLEVLFLVLLALYPFSYAKYNWQHQNKWGAFGTALVTVAAILFPSYIIFTR